MSVIRVVTLDEDSGKKLSVEDVSNSDEGVKMKKSIGLLSSITIIVGSVIGSGIFVSPSGIIKHVHSFGASIIIWVVCGIFSLLGAYCYAELGTMMPRSGGDYSYVLEAFGPLIGFLRLWVEVMVGRPGAVAIISLTFARYILQPIFPDCDQPESAVTLLAIVCVLTVGFVNAISTMVAARVQDVFTAAKLIALIMIIITGMVKIGQGGTEGFEDAFEGSNWNPGSITTAFYAGLFAYSGWNYLNCMIEEMANPRRDLPIAIVFSCLLVTAVYTLANVAYVSVMSVREILDSPAVAVTFSVRVYGPVWWIMPIFVAFSTFGGVNGTVLTTSRMFFVASQENQMPSFLSFLHVNRLTPIPAVIFTCVISIVYILVGDIYALMTAIGFVQWLAIGVSVFIVIVFRFTRPKAERPIKAPLIFAIIYVAVTLFLVIFAFVDAPKESLSGTAILLSGIPVYILGCKWKKPKSFQKKFGAFTTGLQKLAQLIPGN